MAWLELYFEFQKESLSSEGYEEVKLHKRKSKNDEEDDHSKSSSNKEKNSKDRSASESEDDEESSSSEDEESSSSSSSSSDDDESDESTDDAGNKTQHDEKQTLGRISWKVYTDYFRSGGGIVGGIFVFLMFILTQLFVLAADYWVSEW